MSCVIDTETKCYQSIGLLHGYRERERESLEIIMMLVFYVCIVCDPHSVSKTEREMLQLCKVTDSLLISNGRSACSSELIQQEAVTLCINVSKQQPFPCAKVSTLRISVYDDPNEDLYQHFDQCADAIANEALRGGRSVVYCKNGRSRSATICLAYLMKHQGLSLAEAFQVGGILFYISHSL